MTFWVCHFSNKCNLILYTYLIMLSNIDLKSKEVCSSVIVVNYTDMYNIISLIDKTIINCFIILLISSYKYSLYLKLNNNNLTMSLKFVLSLIKKKVNNDIMLIVYTF